MVYMYTHYFCQCTMLFYHSCLVRKQKQSNLVDQSHLYYIIGIYKWNLQVILVYIWGISTVDPSKASEAIKKTTTQIKPYWFDNFVKHVHRDGVVWCIRSSTYVVRYKHTYIYIEIHMYTHYIYIY